jgi:hypothetical protein
VRRGHERVPPGVHDRSVADGRRSFAVAGGRAQQGRARLDTQREV